MSTSSSKHDNSDDEFESADEGESIVESVTKSLQSSSPLQSTSAISPENQAGNASSSLPANDGWGDWNIDDEQLIKTARKDPTSMQQDSISSRSSSPAKTGGSSSRVGSDEDDQTDLSNQQRLQRKKYRKKHNDLNINNEENKTSNPHSSCLDNEKDEDELQSSTGSATKHHVEEAYHVLDRIAAQSQKRTPVWHSPWGNFGSLLSTAKQSVSTLTSTVSEGFNAVIESVEAGLGAPDPQKLAEMNQMAFRIKGETSDSEDEPEITNVQNERDDSVVNQDGWLNALSLDKLTTTGMKVVSGSLDVLETVGKKTFEVINDADPELKGTRRLLNRNQQPTLSEIIREAETENKTTTTNASSTKNERATFLQLFEKHLGLAHFEALELLSNQSSTILQTMRHGNEKILEQIGSYFQVNDDENDVDDVDDERNVETTSKLDSKTTNDDNDKNQIPTLDILSQKFTGYQTQLRSTVSAEKLLEVYESANQFLKEWDWMDTELDQQTLADEAIDCLAILCAHIIEYYRKTAELFLVGCKSLTSYSIDIELLAIYEKQQKDFANMLAGIPNLFAKHMKQISNVPPNTSGMPVRCDPKLKQKLLNQIFIQSSSSQTYAADAYVLLKPIVSQSILYHRSTTR